MSTEKPPVYRGPFEIILETTQRHEVSQQVIAWAVDYAAAHLICDAMNTCVGTETMKYYFRRPLQASEEGGTAEQDEPQWDWDHPLTLRRRRGEAR